MYRPRIIPLLLLHNNGLVITKKFSNPHYIGDPVNILKIFNEKFADEIFIADISCRQLKKEINYSLLSEMASEAFMPVTYSGGIQRISDIERIIACGIEKVCINSYAANKSFLKEACQIFGSSTIASVVDVGKNWLGKIRPFSHQGKKQIDSSLIDYVKYLEDCGVGEIVIQDIQRDGIRSGYNLPLLKEVLQQVNTPVIVAGGAKDYNDLKSAILAGAAGAAAGSLFAYSGAMNAVLINFPDERFRKNLI
ncbi:MAG: HisA/HisF-related TIM barrel protein [Bacteroidota bacterium]|jgi:cyclase